MEIIETSTLTSQERKNDLFLKIHSNVIWNEFYKYEKKSRQWHHLKTPCLLLNLHASIDPEHLNTQRHCNMYFCTYLTNGNTNFIKEILLFFLYNTGGPLQVDNQYVIFLLLFFLDILFRFTYDRPSSKRLKLVLFLLFTLKIQYFEEDWYFFSNTTMCFMIHVSLNKSNKSSLNYFQLIFSPRILVPLSILRQTTPSFKWLVEI